MKVLLIKDVQGTGKAGEVKDVKDGYGKNFLVGKGFALMATTEVLAKYEEDKKIRLELEAKEIALANDIATKLSSQNFTISHKVGANGHLIGSVTNKEIAEILKTQASITIDKKQITLKSKIKSTGIFEVDCKLGHGIHGLAKIDVIAAV
ncbi:MAG: 50S ribosomal protein L9 [Campylobacteraceae bacterium]|nr:50S ribosomal protein L9 [Campylobacteraceae bacterium]